MSLLGRLFQSEKRAYKTSIPTNSEGFGADSGEWVSERSALRLITVYACVRLLADNIASLPLDVYRKKDGVREEISPTPQLIRQPYSQITEFEWKFQTVSSLALRGDSYHLILARDRFEFPVQMMPLHPDMVQVEPDRDSGLPVYKVDGEKVPRADILHIRRFVLPGSITGLSPIEQARQGIGLGLAAERYGARYFGDSANPSAVLESENDLNDTQAERNQKSWIASHGGRRYPAMLSGGLKYRQISINPDEAQFLETRKFQRGEIAMLFGIPPHMIGDTEKSTSWGTGIEQQAIGFVKFTLRPWLTCIEASLSNLLPRGQFVRFNVDALLRGDMKSRFEAYRLATGGAAWLNADYVRGKEDLPPIPDGSGQVYLQPLNMGPLGSDPLAEQDEPAQEEPEDDDEPS